MAHVVNLGNVDVMKNITKIAVVENATAILEYDPSRDDNRVLEGSLDVIAAIRTVAIKVFYLSYSHLFTYLISSLDSGIRTANRRIPEHSDSMWI